MRGLTYAELTADEAYELDQAQASGDDHPDDDWGVL